MVTLRADPWMPDHGMGFQARDDETPASADPFVETEDWSRPIGSGPRAERCVVFVDGVRRADLRLIAEEGPRRVPGLLGSFAVGAVRCDGAATFGDHEVRRAVVLGGGVRPEPMEVAVGEEHLTFEPESVTGDDPDGPLAGLQARMRKVEGLLAAKAAAEGDVLVLADGPLAFFDSTVAPVVGVIKRTMARYLSPDYESLIAQLAPGRRTPLFGLGDHDRVRRYSWYTRLVPLRVPWHDRAGIVRCEVRAGLGLQESVEVAHRVSALLPAYAGRPSDPRTPQNLAPVAGLEGWLRHRMGHALIVRRALLEHLFHLSGEAA